MDFQTLGHEISQPCRNETCCFSTSTAASEGEGTGTGTGPASPGEGAYRRAKVLGSPRRLVQSEGKEESICEGVESRQKHS